MPTHSKIHIRYGNAAGSIGLVALARKWTLAATCMVSFAVPQSANAEMALLMFEETGCVWCAQWNADVGGEYPITPEGRAAPLVRMDLHAPLDDTLSLTSRPRFSPTFILVDDRVEIGRIEGYPGEDFFWGLLGRLLEQATPRT